MRSLGIHNFRLSLAWPRLFPNGTGELNQARPLARPPAWPSRSCLGRCLRAALRCESGPHGAGW